jgi:hypothetical protein
MKAIVVAGIMAGLLVAAPASAQRALEPVVNFPNQPVATSSGKPLQPEQVKQAIVDGAARAREWTLAYEPNGTVVATRQWRTHSITVAIAYSSQQYSIAYRDSSNMKYTVNSADPNAIPARNAYPQPAGPVIHPFYNRYVRELKSAIDAELRKL